MFVKNVGRLLGAIGVFFSFALTAQNYFIEQALLFSRQNAGGSARIQAMGGAQVALGGDFSSALSNPAGLGMYNRNEFTITPAFSLQNSSSTYTTSEFDAKGNIIPTIFNSSSSSSNVSLPGLSIVFGSNKNDEKAPFLGGTFAITLNRINDFNGGFEYKGQNNGSSLIDYFIETSNGYTKDQFDPKFDPNSNAAGKGDNVNTPAFLGYENYLLGSTTANGTVYGTDVTGRPLQSETVKTSGSQNQWSISYGANFMDKVFLGAGLGITSVRYSYDKAYKENYEGQNVGPPCNDCFNNLQLKETRSTTGSGINLTLGALFKPIDFAQFGVSYVTPTAYQLNDTYSANMNTSWNSFDYYGNGKVILNSVSSKTIDDPVSYGLNTPSRFTFGTAFFFPKKGFITADVELVNYSNASTSNFSQQSYSLTIDADTEVNKKIAPRFKSATNIRIGAEYRIKKFRIRGGYNLMGDPYLKKPTDRINYSLTNVSSISGGIGYRGAKFYVDLAIINTQGDGYYVPYAVASPINPYLNYSNSTTRIMFTVGFPF
jgi:hypothetical protein